MTAMKGYKPSVGFIIIISIIAFGVIVYLMQRADLFTKIGLYAKYGSDLRAEYTDVDEIFLDDQVDGCNRNVHYLSGVSLPSLQNYIVTTYPELLASTNNNCAAYDQPDFVYKDQNYQRVISISTDNEQVTAIVISSNVDSFEQVDTIFWNTILQSIEPTLVEEQWLDNGFEQLRIKYEENSTWDKLSTQRHDNEYTLSYSDTPSGIYISLTIIAETTQ